MNKITSISLKLVTIATVLVLSITNSVTIAAHLDTNANVLSSNQNAIIVTYQDVRIDFRSLDEIHVVEELEIKNLQNESISELEFWPSLDINFRNIEVVDEEYAPVNSIQNEFTRSITIYFDQQIDTNQSFIIRVDYYLDVTLDKIGKKSPYYCYFQFSPKIVYYTQEYNVTIGLPKNSWLHEDDIIHNPFHPINATYDSSGTRIFLYWAFSNIEPSTDFVISVWFDEPLDSNNPLWAYIVGPLGGTILGAAGVYWFMKRKKEKVMKEVGNLFLTQDQKLILNLIIESEGKITQKELIEKTGFTKSKISRNLTPLENNELISKERWGREYSVFITDRGKKVIE